MIIDLTEQQWRDRRREPGACHIGASQAAAALGVGGFVDATPMEIWRAHHDPTWTPKAGAHLARGHRLEPLLLQDYARGLDDGYRLELAPHRIAVHDDYPWLSATPDGWVDGPYGLAWTVEAKTDGEYGARHLWPADGEEVPDLDATSDAPPMPLHYWVQVQVQMACLRTPWVDMPVLLSDLQPRRIRVHASPNRTANMLRRLAAWRTRHLVGGEMPPPTDDRERIAAHARAHGAPAGSLRATGDADRLLSEALAMQAEADRLAREIPARIAGLLPILGGHRELWSEAGKLVAGRNPKLKPR